MRKESGSELADQITLIRQIKASTGIDPLAPDGNRNYMAELATLKVPDVTEMSPKQLALLYLRIAAIK